MPIGLFGLLLRRPIRFEFWPIAVGPEWLRTAKSGRRQAKATDQKLLTMMEAFCLENRVCILAFRYIDVHS
jgi:hypothetical protein